MINDTQREWAYILYANGTSGAEIAKRMDVSAATISRLKTKEGWDRKGKNFPLCYADVIQAGLQIIGLLQLDVLSKQAVNCSEQIRNIRHTANMIESLERLNFDVSIRQQLQSLEKHMEYLKTVTPFPERALELTQVRYDELVKELV